MAVSLTLAKQQCRVDGANEEDLIGQYILSAAKMVEDLTGNLLTRREVTQQFDAFASRMPLHWGPSPASLTVAYTDTDEVAQEIIDAKIVRNWLYPPTTGWPGIALNTVIEVTYTAGWATPEPDLVAAQLLLIAHWYANREAVDSAGTSKETALAVEALCRPYRSVLSRSL